MDGSRQTLYRVYQKKQTINNGHNFASTNATKLQHISSDRKQIQVLYPNVHIPVLLSNTAWRIVEKERIFSLNWTLQKGHFHVSLNASTLAWETYSWWLCPSFLGKVESEVHCTLSILVPWRLAFVELAVSLSLLLSVYGERCFLKLEKPNASSGTIRLVQLQQYRGCSRRPTEVYRAHHVLWSLDKCYWDNECLFPRYVSS